MESGVIHSRVVGAGDIVQVGFFMNMRATSASYKIETGDVVRVDVVDHPELDRDGLLVLPDGRVSLSLLGSIVAAGKTVEDLGEELSALYLTQKIKDAKAIVSVTKDRQRVRSFLQSLETGQGMGQVELRVFDDQQWLHLPFIPQVQVGRPFETIQQEIREAYQREFGDQLEVTVNLAGRVPPQVYVMGEVKKPGSVELSRGGNVLTAIAMAGGFTDTAREGKVLVVRFKDDGSYDHWNFDVKDQVSTEGRQRRFALQSHDVIFVAKSAIAKVDLFVEQYIRRVLPLDVGIGAYVPLSK